MKIYDDVCCRIFSYLNGFRGSNNGRKKGTEMPISLHIQKILRCEHATPFSTPCICLRGKLCYLHCNYSSLDHYNEFMTRPNTYSKDRKLLDWSGYTCIIISAIYFTPFIGFFILIPPASSSDASRYCPSEHNRYDSRHNIIPSVRKVAVHLGTSRSAESVCEQN